MHKVYGFVFSILIGFLIFELANKFVRNKPINWEEFFERVYFTFFGGFIWNNFWNN